MEPEPASRAAASPTKALPDERVNILLVDDRPDKLLALEAILTDLGENLVKAYSGKEALRALLRQDFAVILLDVNMPGMDGFETAALARQRKRTERTPIIFFTAQEGAEAQAFRSYSLGAVDFIRTPVVPEILKAKVSVFVDLFRKTEQVRRQAEEMRVLQEREHERRMAEAADRLEAETKRNRFFTMALDMLAIADFGGTLKQLNPSWEKTLGFSERELTSRPLLEFVHPDDREATAEQFTQLRAGASISYFENRIATRGGGYRWLGWTAAPFAEEGLLYIFARDLTERRLAEEERVQLIREQTARAAAEASERRTAFLAEATAILSQSLDHAEVLSKLVHLGVPSLADWCFIDVLDEDGEVRRVEVAHADPEKAALAREVKQFALGRGWQTPQTKVIETRTPLVVPEVTPDVVAPFTRGPDHARIIEAVGARSLLVVPLVARDRSLGALTYLTAESGRVFGRDDLEVAQELARRASLALDNARLYKASQEARQAAERANRAKDEFLATLSHELRTPLTPILGWTVMLRGGNLDAESMRRGLEVIERNVRVQTQLIGDLLDVSRIITGKLRLEVRPIEAGPVVEAGVDAVRPTADAKGIRLTVDIQKDIPQTAADPDRLQQIVWNLASNAVKFTPNGGHVEVMLRQEGPALCLMVRDSGLGIRADFLPHVFERFRQADSTSTRAHGGLGLGLAIVRHLVELHGGTVKAESPGEGQGSSFTVKLPISLAPGVRAAEKPAMGPVRLEGVRVMVVDDEEDIRDFLQLALRDYGAEVATFATSEEALLALPSHRPDVLVSDIGMPGEDGYAFIQRVRALGADRGGQVPAAALTAYAKGEDTERVLSAGYQAHLPKPVQPDALASAVAGLARRK